MRHTKIVATIGPASWDFEQLEKLSVAGVNIFRLNFSHGTHEGHGEVIKRIKKLNQKLGKHHAILLDTKGPEVRTGDMKVPINVKKGEKLIFTIEPTNYETSGKIKINYDAFIDDVEVGEKILVDSGVINLKVLEKTKKDVICEVLDGGEISSRRHVNLPGKDVSLESITEKDWNDIKFGVEIGVDFIALSFVRRSDEIYELKKFLEEKNAKISVIAKIESFEATKHLGTICNAADGLMVARGDLGAEVPFYEVPRIQREIVKTAGEYQKPVIVATHMLESMIEHPIPTRAEVTDVSEAVWQRADGIMLSGETATGKFPIRSVETMAQIALTTEKESKLRTLRKLKVTDSRDAFARLAAQMPKDLTEIKAIFVVTRSGMSAQAVSAFRPNVPIFAFSNVPQARRKLQLVWGVESFRIDFSSVPQKTIMRSEKIFLKHHPEWKGKKYVLVSDSLIDGAFIPTLQVREL